MADFLLNDLPQLAFICFGLYVIARSTADMFFPKMEGRVVGMELRPKCRAANVASTILVDVKLGDGSIEQAEMSSCTACLEKIKEGDVVTLLPIGNRLVVQKGVSWCL